uniref:Uncharacterized protein n=1 Tax=Neovison vison TaxID=452646 RepID=A0A8C7AQV5_NEOVI
RGGAFQERAPGARSCQQWFPESRPEWRAPSRTHRTRPRYSSYQSSGFLPHTRCPPPGRAQQRRCPRPRSTCLPETWTCQRRRCAHSVWAAPPRGFWMTSFRALCCLRSAGHSCLDRPQAA